MSSSECAILRDQIKVLVLEKEEIRSENEQARLQIIGQILYIQGLQQTCGGFQEKTTVEHHRNVSSDGRNRQSSPINMNRLAQSTVEDHKARAKHSLSRVSSVPIVQITGQSYLESELKEMRISRLC